MRRLLVEKFSLPPEGNQIIAVIRYPQHEDGFKQLVFSWKESIESYRKKTGFLGLSVPIDRTFNPGLENASVYVSVSVDEKFEISKGNVTRPTSEIYHYHHEDHEYIGTVELVDKVHYDIILKDKKRFDLRIPRNFFDSIHLEFDVKIPTMVSLWLFFGILIGVGAELSLIFGTSIFKELIPFVGGAIAVLIALRLVLFHDIELLKTWNYSYLVMIGIIIMTLIAQIFIFLK